MNIDDATCNCQLCTGDGDDTVWGAWDRQTAHHVRQHGWSVVGIGADERVPGWAYSVGVWHTLRQPELCICALPMDVAHGLVNDVGDRVRSGAPLRYDEPVRGVIQGYELAVRPVHESWFNDMFCAALRFYERPPLAFRQLVWPDADGRFPWEAGAGASCRAQPMLWLPRDDHPDCGWLHLGDDPLWPFPDGCPDQGVFTTLRVMDGRAEIVAVVHDEDGDWQFLDGAPIGLDDIASVQLKHVVDAHPGVAALADLRRGEQAFRQGDGSWLRLPRDRPGLDVPRQWR
jgi:hypothetical protein